MINNELANANLLDDQFSYIGGPLSSIVQGVGAGLQGLGNISQSFKKDEVAQQLKQERKALNDRMKATCGKRPLLGKKKKQTYQKCIDKFNQEEAKLKQAEIDLQKFAINTQAQQQRMLAEQNKTIIPGLPNGIFYTGIGILGTGLIVGIFLYIKKASA